MSQAPLRDFASNSSTITHKPVAPNKYAKIYYKPAIKWASHCSSSTLGETSRPMPKWAAATSQPFGFEKMVLSPEMSSKIPRVSKPRLSARDCWIEPRSCICKPNQRLRCSHPKHAVPCGWRSRATWRLARSSGRRAIRSRGEERRYRRGGGSGWPGKR